MAKDILGKEENQYFSGQNIILYRSAIAQIKKGNTHLRPLFEAFINAWESFSANTQNKKILIRICLFSDGLLPDVQPHYRFNKIIVEDNGTGFNQTNYERFERLNDNTKGNKNKGTGRIQYLHYFDKTDFESYYEQDGSFYKKTFCISGSPKFLEENAILYYKKTEQVNEKQTGTRLVFTEPLNNNTLRYYETLSIETLKKELLRNYILLFCNLKEFMPQIILKREVDGEIKETVEITKDDIPNFEKSIDTTIKYKEYKDDKVIELEKTEAITIHTLKIDSEQLLTNQIILSAKGESIKSNIKLDCLREKDTINNKRYLFILKSNYFDEKVSNDRGSIDLISVEELKKSAGTLFSEPVILIGDVQDKINTTIIEKFPEIKEKQEGFQQHIEELRKMFLLNPKALSSVKITSSDNDKDILAKVYKYDTDVLAQRDSLLKKKIEELRKLDTSDPKYEEKLSKQVDDLVTQIPLQNRTALTQYVARRQLILTQLDLILKRKLDCQSKDNRNKDEKLLHNLIFQQSSTDTKNSSLWLLNEEFIYFSGISESRLCDVRINNERVFKEEITEAEKEYLHEFGEKRENLRPDILLFPNEGKAIIIEFKAPDVNASKYITQIPNYAALLMNYCEPKFNIKTFYGYLIGENIDSRDVRHHNPNFTYAPNFDYLFLGNYI